MNAMKQFDTSDFGIGVYTAPEAARMIGMRSATLRRWLSGYDHDGKSERELWSPQHVTGDEGLYLGFRDLIEARIVNALRECRIGLPTIRLCLERAREIVGDERPFSTREFRTDGKRIFFEITKGIDEPEFIDLRSGQGVFKRVVEPSLKDLEFDDFGAARWWLLRGKKSVVADPDYAFGQPVLADSNITTKRIGEALQAEGSVQRVSALFEIAPSLVRDALRYEEKLGEQKVA